MQPLHQQLDRNHLRQMVHQQLQDKLERQVHLRLPQLDLEQIRKQGLELTEDK